MNESTTLILLSGVTVAFGRWSQNKSFDFKTTVAVLVLIILMSIFSTFAPEVATPLSAIVLVAVLLNYGPSIFKHIG